MDTPYDWWDIIAWIIPGIFWGAIVCSCAALCCCADSCRSYCQVCDRCCTGERGSICNPIYVREV